MLDKARQLGLGDYAEGAFELVGALAPLEGFRLPPLDGAHHQQATRTFIESRVAMQSSGLEVRDELDLPLAVSGSGRYCKCTESFGAILES